MPPKYFDYDDTRCLARRAIWALGNIGGSDVEAKLQLLARSGDPNLQEAGQEQLDRLHGVGEYAPDVRWPDLT